MAASEAMSGEERRSILAAALARGPHSELADTSSENDDTDIEDQVGGVCSNGITGKQHPLGGQQLYQLARNSSVADSSSMSLAQQYLLTVNEGSNNTSLTSSNHNHQQSNHKQPYHKQAKKHLKHMLQSIPVPLIATSIITVVILCLLLRECKSFQLTQPEPVPAAYEQQQHSQNQGSLAASFDEIPAVSLQGRQGVEAESLVLNRELVNGGGGGVVGAAALDLDRGEEQPEKSEAQVFESFLANPQIVDQQTASQQVLNNLLNQALSDAAVRQPVFDSSPAEIQRQAQAQDISGEQLGGVSNIRHQFGEATAPLVELEPMSGGGHQVNQLHPHYRQQPAPHNFNLAAQSMMSQPMNKQHQHQHHHQHYHQQAAERDKQHYHRPARNNEMPVMNSRLMWHPKYYNPRLHQQHQNNRQQSQPKTLRDIHLEQSSSSSSEGDYHVKQIECNDTREGVQTFGCPIPDAEGRHKCIVTGSFCNGYLDCPHGEDEDILTCFHYSTLMASIDILANSQYNLLKKLHRRELNTEQSEPGK